jgi:hypothetical protein
MGLSYKHFLYGAVTFTTLLAALFKIGLFDGAISGLMALFLGVLYFGFMVWAIAELWTIHKSEPEQLEVAGPQVSLSGEDRPDEDALTTAKTYLSLGESLDTVCAFVNPKYQDWDLPKRAAFRQGLNALLAERQSQAPRAEASGE